MGSNFLEDGQLEARHQVQQALDALYTTAGMQHRCHRALWAAGHDANYYLSQMGDLCRRYVEQDNEFRLLEEAYHKRFPGDLEPFITTIDLTPR